MELIKDFNINAENLIDTLINENFFKYNSNAFNQFIESLVRNKKYKLLEKLLLAFEKTDIKITNSKLLFQSVRSLKQNCEYNIALKLIQFIEYRSAAVKTKNECNLWTRLILLAKSEKTEILNYVEKLDLRDKKKEFLNYIEDLNWRLDIDSIDEFFTDLFKIVDKTNDTRIFNSVVENLSAQYFNNFMDKLIDYYNRNKRYNDGIKFIYEIYNNSKIQTMNINRSIFEHFFRLIDNSRLDENKLDTIIIESMITKLIIKSAEYQNFSISAFTNAVERLGYHNYVAQTVDSLNLRADEKIYLAKTLMRFRESKLLLNKAAALLEQNLESGFYHRDIYSMSAEINNYLGKYNKSVYYWKKNIEAQMQTNFYLLKTYGEYLYKAGDIENAVKNLETALKYDRNNRYLWNRYNEIAKIHFDNKNFDAAIEYYNKAIETADYNQFKDWTAKNIFEQLSKCYINKNDYFKAVETLHNAIPYIKQNDRKQIVDEIVKLIIDNKILDKFADYYEKQSENDNAEKPYLRLALGVAYDQIWEYDKSIQYIESAKKYLPNDKEIMSRLL